MDNFNTKRPNDSVQNRTIVGIWALMLRSLVINALKAASIIVLSRLLSPEDYGKFGIVSSWIGFAYYFCDVGISGALVYQKENPKKEQYQICFFVQMFLSLSLFVLMYIFAPSLSKFHKFDESDIWMIRVLALAIPIYGLKGISKVKLEREINFKIIAKIDLIENMFLYLSQISFAFLGFKVWSFIWANLIRAISSSLFTISYTRLIVSPKFVLSEFKKLLKFGFHFQLNATLPALRGLLIPLILSPLIHIDIVGVVAWTYSLASIPTILAVNYNQVLFPSLSRLNEDLDEYKRFATRAMEMAILWFGLIYGYFLVAGGPAINLFFPDKWDFSIVLFPLAIIFHALTNLRYLCASMFNSIGKPDKRFNIEIITMIFEFIFCYILTKNFGAKGYFGGLIIVAISSLIYSYITLRKILRLVMFWRLISVSLISVFLFYSLEIISDNFILRSLLFFIIFPLILVVIDKNAMIDFKWIWNKFVEKLKR